MLPVSTMSRPPALQYAGKSRADSPEQPPLDATPKDVLQTSEGPPVAPSPRSTSTSSPVRTPLYDKVVTAAFMGAAAWTATNIGVQIAGLPPVGAVLAGVGALGVAAAAWLTADAGSGAFHFLVDNYGGPKTPVMGTIIKEFQAHHLHPEMEAQSVWSNCAQVGQFLAPALAATAWANPHLLVQAGALSALTAGYLAQASHRWAHMGDRAPALAKALQKLHVLMPRKLHAEHHAEPVATYCIVNGACNRLLDGMNAWRKVEYGIYKATGAESNTWFDPEIKKKAMGTGNPADFADPVKRREGRRVFWEKMTAKIRSWGSDGPQR